MRNVECGMKRIRRAIIAEEQNEMRMSPGVICLSGPRIIPHSVFRIPNYLVIFPDKAAYNGSENDAGRRLT